MTDNQEYQPGSLFGCQPGMELVSGLVRKYIPAQWPYISSFLIQIGRDTSAAENFVPEIFLSISDFDIWWPIW